jgi:ABC-2 type transport system ATP-binding protein
MTLEVKNITKFYSQKRALNDISFGLSQGEIVGLLGPNGAGKSTLMKIITGGINFNSGSVEICGQKVSRNNVLFKHHIGYLPETNPLYPDMYIREYLRFASEFYNIPDKKAAVEDAIERTGLASESHKKILHLSKGYRQRVGIAQAILHNPQVLILDEPTTGLDPNQILEIRDLIAEIGKNHTVIFSTHILQEVSAICSRIIVLNSGEIVADRSVAELKRENKLETFFRQLTQ